MSFFSDILNKIKKPVDALKDFLTPKERKSIEEKEKTSPVQRVETKLPSFEYKPPSLEGVKNFISSFVPPKEVFERKELLPKETPEERAARLEKARETTKKIAEFGKSVLRAGPRAAASVTLEAQGRRTMIPETKAEKFLFGEEPIESVGERIERFPERAKEFGIPESVSKKIAPFAIVGLTALDILPPLPGKGVAEQTIKELAEKYGDDIARQIIKKGGKELVEKALEAGGEAALKKAGIAAQFVREFKYELPAHLMPAKGKPTWNIGKTLWNTMRSGNVQGQDLARDKGAMSWVIDRLSGGKAELESLLQKYAGARSTNKQYKKLYAVLKSKNYNIEDYKKVMSELKGIEPMVIEHKLAPAVSELKAAAQKTPTAVLKEAAESGVHSKKLEEGLNEAYFALDKAGKDEVYDLGKVGDYIADPKVKEQYKDVLDTPLYAKRQVDMGKAHGSLSVDPKGNPAIVLSDGLTADTIDRTLVEELTHAKQFQKGVRPTADISYKEIPEEIRAKQAAKYFAPKTTLEDLIGAGAPAKPSEELKKILYHGTDFENVPKIQKGGFKVGGFLAHGYPQGVYFTTTKKEAQNYGKVIQSTTKLKLSEFFDVSKHKELNGLSGNKYVQKLNQIIREAAESKGVEIPKPSAKQLKQYTDMIGDLKDPLDISDIKTATLQKLGYKGFIAAEKGIGKEIVVFNPNDISVLGKPTEALKAAVPKISKELQPLAESTYKESGITFGKLQGKKLSSNIEGVKSWIEKNHPDITGFERNQSMRLILDGEANLRLDQGKTDVVKSIYQDFYNQATKETKPAILEAVTPIFERGKPVTTPVIRQSQKGFESTDKFRGGTWYSTPESKTFDFTAIGEKAERGVGGAKKIETTIDIKNPLVIKNAAIEDGSGSVIQNGYENFLPEKYRKAANGLYDVRFGEKADIDLEIMNALYDAGIPEVQAKKIISSTNKWDAAMDAIIGNGLKKSGYDALVLENEFKGKVIDRHIFKFAEAEKVKPTAELKEILKGKAVAEKLPDIPEIKGAKAIDLSKPAKVTEPSKVQEIIGEYQKRINTTPAKKAAISIKKTFDDTYTAIIDRFHPITKLARKATDLRPGENPELLARRYLGVQGIAESKLFWNTTRLTAEGNLEVTGPGLSKILKPAKNNIDDLRTLMIAERDIELSKRTLEGGKKVIGTTPEKSGQVINALKQKYGESGFGELSKTVQGIREWSRKALLDPLLEVGALSKEQYEVITKSNEFYVPFQRVIEELETHGFVPKKANIFSPKSVPIKKLKGSVKDIIDPFESMITNAYKITDFVERARVGRSIANLRKASSELAEMIKPINPKIVPVAKQGEELIFRPSFFTPDKNTIMVFENGKRKFYQVPEDVFKAVSGMTESDVGTIMKVLAFPARTLRAGATLTPEFMGRNPLRDQFTAFVFSKYGYVPGVDLVKGIFNTVGKTDLYGRWLAGGGAHSMFVSLDRMTSQATLAKVLGAKDIKGMVKNPLEALRILSEFGEKGTRVGAFGRAVKKGVSDIEAAFESRDITLDFARRGSQTRAVNMLVAFWNAQVQGLNKLVRAFRERPMQTTFKAASGITLPSVLLYLNNRNDPRYQELPQWQKDLFWILPIGDKGPIIRIPKPFEVGIIFGTVPEHILTWLDKNDPEALTSAAKTLMEASAPGYIPTGLQPIIENVANYSFFQQRPIVSEGKEALPKELQAGRYTSETAKEVGKLIKQSPAKIENLFVSYTGGLGKYALDASDKLLKTLGVISPPSEPSKTLADQPFIKAFVAREPIGSGSESVNKFYKLYDEANATKAAVKGLAEEGKEQEAINYLRSHPAGFYTKGLNKVARTFSDLRKKRDAVLDSRELNPEQKKRAIDALDKIMTEIARQTVELVGSSNEKFRQ